MTKPLEVKATLERLAAYQSWGYKLYVTPTTTGEISESYWNNGPQFQNDYAVATPEDFLRVAGYDDEISSEDAGAFGDQILRLTIEPAEEE